MPFSFLSFPHTVFKSTLDCIIIVGNTITITIMRVFVVLKSLNKVNKQLCSVHSFTTEGLILATSTILKYKDNYSPNMFHIIILSRVNINIGDHYNKNWIVSIDEINRTIKLSNNSEPIKYKSLI